MDKKQLRKNMIHKRLELDEDTYKEYSRLIRERLYSLPDFVNADSIALYMSCRNEVDTRVILKDLFDKKKVYVPKCVGDDLEFYEINSFDDVKPGYFHVEEPITEVTKDIKDIDFVVVPLLMFDETRNRIGYGRGFYDRSLKEYKGTTCGIAFDFQKIEDTKPHTLDIPLDMIITEKKVY